MDKNTLVYGLISLVVLFAVAYGFYTLTNPEFDIIKSLKCNLPVIGEIICPKEDIITQQQIQQQTAQAQLQNVQSIQNAMKYQFLTCGQNDPNPKCRCTYSFGVIGDQVIVITQLKDKIRITAGGKNEEVNIFTLYYDDLNHNLLGNRKLNEGDQIIFNRENPEFWYNDHKFFIKLKPKGKSVQEAIIIKEYSVAPVPGDGDARQLSEYINGIGLFKDTNNIGIYLPNVKEFLGFKYHWSFEDWEKDPLPECKQ